MFTIQVINKVDVVIVVESSYLSLSTCHIWDIWRRDKSIWK